MPTYREHLPAEDQEPEPQDQTVVVATETQGGELQPPTPEGPEEVDVKSLPPHVHWAGMAAGSASRREIREEDFKREGVEDQATVVWSRDNDFRVPLSELTEEAQKIVARQDNMHFVNTEESAEPADETVEEVATETPSRHGKKK